MVAELLQRVMSLFRRPPRPGPVVFDRDDLQRCAEHAATRATRVALARQADAQNCEVMFGDNMRVSVDLSSLRIDGEPLRYMEDV